MKTYDVIEFPNGWRVVEHNKSGEKFHMRQYRTRADAQRRADQLSTTALWLVAVAGVRRRAGHQCECLGECGRSHTFRCSYVAGALVAGLAGQVVLSVVALDHHDENLDPANLRAYCQLCRQYYDADAANTDALFQIDG